MDLTHIYEKLKPIAENGVHIYLEKYKDIALYNELSAIADKFNHKFNIININRNFPAHKHKDGSALKGSNSMVMACGEYTGGELFVEGEMHNTFHNPVIFDGLNKEHWNNPHIGDKISIVWWSVDRDMEFMARQLNPYDLTEIYPKLKEAFPAKQSITYKDESNLYKELVEIGKSLNFEFDSIQIVHNVSLPAHKDKGVKGKSMCISCGDYTGGELVIGGIVYNAYHRPTIFNGVDKEHYNKPIQGDKYSIVYWTKI